MPYINHVALPVDDVEKSSAFYVDWFDARIIPSPKFPVPVAWLLVGKIQIHLVQHASTASTAYHFAITVDDRDAFERLYWRAEREGLIDTDTFPHHIFVLPGGEVQMWIRDVAGNVIEVDYPHIADLDPRIAGTTRRWAQDCELTEWNRQASLFRPEQAGIALTGALASHSVADHNAAPESSTSATVGS
ncbi:MAG: VOC family protein [Mycobacterium sp.]